MKQQLKHGIHDFARALPAGHGKGGRHDGAATCPVIAVPVLAR
jgi:hypothetical protein